MTTPPPPGADDPPAGQTPPDDLEHRQAGEQAQPPTGKQAQSDQPTVQYPSYPPPPQAGQQAQPYPNYPPPTQAAPQGQPGYQWQPPPSYPGYQPPPGYPPPGYQPPPGYPPPGSTTPPGPYGNPAGLPSGYPAYPQPDYLAYPTPNAAGSVTGDTGDPLVPANFDGWFRRVFQVFRRSFGQLTLLAVIPMVILAAYFVTLDLIMPGMMQSQLSPATAGTDPMAGVGELYLKLLPAMAIFLVPIFVASAFQQVASIFVIVRDANGQPTTALAALRATASRVPRYVGWLLLVVIGSMIAFFVPMLPAVLMFAIGGPPGLGIILGVLGYLVSLVLITYLWVVIYSSLFGVLGIERGNVRRCFQLIKGRFWACFGRLTIAGLCNGAYVIALFIVIGLLSVVVAATGLGVGGTVVVSFLEAVLFLPVIIFQTAVSIVTYAELRFRENPATRTATLAAELAR